MPPASAPSCGPAQQRAVLRSFVCIYGMRHATRNLRKRDEHKSALRHHPRMRNPQAPPLAPRVIQRKQNIHINRPRASFGPSVRADRRLPSDRSISSSVSINPPGVRSVSRLHHSIEKPSFPTHIHRLRLVKRRLSSHANTTCAPSASIARAIFCARSPTFDPTDK